VLLSANSLSFREVVFDEILSPWLRLPKIPQAASELAKLFIKASRQAYAELQSLRGA